MRVRISRTHYPVTVLGPGRRAGIWLQGCTIRCPGCIAVDTWPADERTAIAVDDVLAWLAELPADVAGVTISGGEPTDQPQALAALLAGIVRWREGLAGPPIQPDILVFTGRAPEWLERAESAVLTGADAVVAGPYDVAAAGAAPLRGSDNQRIVPLTELGRDRYRDPARYGRDGLQLQVVDDQIWLVGIPRPGTMAELRRAAQAGGLRLRGVSWRS
jgi:anaerobic ribonucleoside-triphosphate reductase activating protein